MQEYLYQVEMQKEILVMKIEVNYCIWKGTSRNSKTSFKVWCKY